MAPKNLCRQLCRYMSTDVIYGKTYHISGDGLPPQRDEPSQH